MNLGKGYAVSKGKFSFVVPIRKAAYQRVDESTGRKHWYVQGYASSTNLDRDGDRMSNAAIKGMIDQIIEAQMTLFVDHNHGLPDGIGVIVKAENRNGYLWIEARLEDPEINPLVKLLLHKLDIGERIGLSIGGDLAAAHQEFDRSLGTDFRMIDGVKLYEISAVGIPSNAESFLMGSVFKSLRGRSTNNEIYSLFCKDGECKLIFKSMKVITMKEELLDMYMQVQKELDRRAFRDHVLRVMQEEFNRGKSEGKYGNGLFTACVEAVSAKGNVDCPECVCAEVHNEALGHYPGSDKGEEQLEPWKISEEVTPASMNSLMAIHDAIKHECISMGNSGKIIDPQDLQTMQEQQPSSGGDMVSKLPDSGRDFSTVQDWYSAQTSGVGPSRPTPKPRVSPASSLSAQALTPSAEEAAATRSQ